MRLNPLRLAACGALLLVPSLLAAQATPAEKTAEQVFKNIQVFQGKPADELRPTMSYIASALGVQCNFCHEQGDFSADTKPEKATARKMVLMVYAINKDSFGGRNQINCFTCHQGHNSPRGNLTIAADEPAGAAGPGGMPGMGPGGPGGRGPGMGGPGGPGGRGGQADRANLPTAQALWDKYVAAIGGQAALDGIQSETITASRVAFGNSSPESLVRAPGKFVMTQGQGAGEIKSGYDGTSFWSASSHGPRDLTTDVIGQLQVDLPLYPGAGLKLASARVFGEQPVGSATAYMMVVRSATGMERYYFDKDSGLLVRYVTATPTYLGSLPLQVDFSDYRAVNGVKLPFDIQWSTHERTWERKVSDIQLNQPVNAGQFAAPAAGGN